ncbi:MAG: OmpA family protein [Pseudomonadota bacterium]
MNTKLLSLVAILSLAAFGTQANSQAIEPGDIKDNGKGAYVIDSDGDVVRDSLNRCVRTINWTVEAAINKCEGIEEPKPKPVAVVVEPAPEPVAFVEPAPEVIPVPPKYTSHFDFNDYDVKKVDIPELNEFAAYLNRDCSCQVAITGHTDSIGPESYNQVLSQERAQEVADYLGNKGVAPSRMIVTGMGESAPVADNMTKAGRAANRRVEVEIIQ